MALPSNKYIPWQPHVIAAMDSHKFTCNSKLHKYIMCHYSISQEICTPFLLCCALLWLYIEWFSHIHQALLHWHCGNLTIAPVPAKQPWWIWINTSCEFIMNGCITTTKQSTTKRCAYFWGYTVYRHIGKRHLAKHDWERWGGWESIGSFLFGGFVS